jgi:hypothetical protein
MQSIMPPQLHIKGANVFHPMQGTLSDVLGLPTMENNGNEDGERWEGMTLLIGRHLMKKPVVSTSGPSTCL